MYLQRNQIILRGSGEINDVLSSVPGHAWRHATDESHEERKEFPLEVYRDRDLPNEPSEAEIAHAGLWERAMKTRDDAELLRCLALSDILGRYIIRIRSGHAQPDTEALASDVPVQEAYEPEFVAPVVSPKSAIPGPVLPIA